MGQESLKRKYPGELRESAFTSFVDHDQCERVVPRVGDFSLAGFSGAGRQ